MNAASSSKKRTPKIQRSRTELRFADHEHHALVARAAKLSGLSINAWIVKTTLAAARKELKEAE